MTNLHYEDAKKRFSEIREEIKKYQLEAEQIILAHQVRVKPEMFRLFTNFRSTNFKM